MGLKRYKEGDYKGPFEYWTEAAALGDAEAHFELSTWYRNGEVLRRMRKNNCTILNRLQLQDTHMPDTILHFRRMKMFISKIVRCSMRIRSKRRC